MELESLSKWAMEAVAVRLQTWCKGDGETTGAPENPATRLWNLYARMPQGFTLTLSWQMHPGGTMNPLVSLSMDGGRPIGHEAYLFPDHIPIADMLVPLDLILAETFARVERLGKAN